MKTRHPYPFLSRKRNQTRANSKLRYVEFLEQRQLMTADVNLLGGVDVPETEDIAAEVVSDPSGQSQGNITSPVAAVQAHANATLETMQSIATATGQIALNKIDELATFAGITIESPVFSADGSVTGTTQFGEADAPVLLQYVAQTGDWILAVQSQLGELLPSNLPVELSFDSPIELDSPYFVFSPSQLQLHAEDMTEGTRAFYNRLYQSDAFTVRLERGVNLLSKGTIDASSSAGEILNLLGVDVPSIEVEGVILRDFTSDAVEDFKQAKKDGNFWSRFREDMLLRATLPKIHIDSLPNNITTGDAYLGWQSPGTDKDVVFAGIDLIMDDGDGTPTLLTGKVGFAETETGSELRLSATARQMNDAFGVTGFDLNEVTMLLDIDTVKTPAADANAKDPTAAIPTVGLGVSASMRIGERDVVIAGKVELNMVTGTPMKVALRGELSYLSSTDLLSFANKLSGLDQVAPDNSNLPNLEFHNLMVNIAPLGGDAELGIEDGIGIRGELHVNGKMIGRVDGLIDRTDVVPKIRLTGWIDEINLGELHVTEVTVDVLMTQSIDDHFLLKGGIELFGASHHVDINVSARYMYYHITTEVDGLGMVDYSFESSTVGVPFWTYSAEVRNDLSNTLEDQVATGVRDWADEVSRDFNVAQANLGAAKRALSAVEQERAEAIMEAQEDFDRIKAGIGEAERAVNGLASQVSSLRRAESSAYSRWRSAVRSTQSASWYNYASRKATEVARYASYRAVQASRITVQGSLNVASGVLAAVRTSAGWVLDAAGPESHPNVIRLTAELAIKTAVLDAAKVALQVVEEVSTGAANVVAFVAESHDDLFMIEGIHFEGTLSAALWDSSLELTVDYSFLSEDKQLTLELESPIDFDELALEVLSRVKELGAA